VLGRAIRPQAQWELQRANLNTFEEVRWKLRKKFAHGGQNRSRLFQIQTDETGRDYSVVGKKNMEILQKIVILIFSKDIAVDN
jgi:hypothetical protein